MKIKKGSVALYVLAMMLVTAGYWNYISNESQTIETVSMSQNNQQNENTTDEHLGDATLVSNNELINEQNEIIEDEEDDEKIETSATQEDGYFQESKLSRDTMYSQTLETYQEILNNSNVSEEQKAIVTQEITELNKEKNAIMICENLISTKGFDNCVIFVNVESISVIVEAKELKADEIAQIQATTAALSVQQAEQNAEMTLGSQQDAQNLQLESAKTQAKVAYESAQIGYVQAKDALKDVESAADDARSSANSLKKVYEAAEKAYKAAQSVSGNDIGTLEQDMKNAKAAYEKADAAAGKHSFLRVLYHPRPPQRGCGRCDL